MRIFETEDPNHFWVECDGRGKALVPGYPHGLADLPLDEPGPGLPRHDLLALIPYRQIAERGFEALDDGTPLLALKVLEQDDRWPLPSRA